MGVALGVAVLGMAAIQYAHLPAGTSRVPVVAPEPTVTPPLAPISQARHGDWTCFVDRLEARPRDRMLLHGWLQKDGGSSPQLPACRIAVRDAHGARLAAAASRRQHSRFGEEFEAVLPRPRAPFTVEVTFIPGEPRADVALPSFTAVIVPMRVVAPNGRVDALVRADETMPAARQHVAQLEICATAGERAPIPWLVNAHGMPVVSRSLNEIDVQPLNVAQYRCEWTDADAPLTLKLLSERSARDQEIRVILRGVRPPPAPKGLPGPESRSLRRRPTEPRLGYNTLTASGFPLEESPS
jgi:hypothetical protein